jgi:peptidoglycan/xylan/chitin deacetylase (PgdA/CDA1 family)
MIAIFNYHSIGSEKYDYSVTPELFEKQLLLIRKHFKIVRLRDLLPFFESKTMPPEDLAVITFDDGLKDNYTNALPILTKFQIPATLFLATSKVGGELATKLGPLQMMTRAELDELNASGLFDFESHGESHTKMDAMDTGAVQEELQNSEQTITDIFGKTPIFFAYPNARYSRETVAEVKKVYTYAFGTSGVISNTKQVKLFELPRVILRTSLPMWKFRLMMYPVLWKIKNTLFSKKK